MTKEEFNETEKLYHYTTFESGLKILKSPKLLFGKLKDMNDINESYRNIYHDKNVSENDVKKELSKYRQCCFTMDSPRKGFDIPAMWGHYAEKGYGICLVFDKNKIFSSQSKNIYHQKIRYYCSYNNEIYAKNNATTFFEKHYKSLFFIKTNDWRYEQEYRILTRVERDDPTYLELNDSIIAIILYSARDIDRESLIIDSINYDIISRIAPNISILAYGSWGGKTQLIKYEDGVPTDWLAEPIKTIISSIANAL